MDPAASVLHYGQEIFEGLKAYRHADGSVWTFRPHANAARLNRSAERLALPQLDEEVFVESLRRLVEGGCPVGSQWRRRSPLPAPIHDRHRGVPGCACRPRGLLPSDRFTGRKLLRRGTEARGHLGVPQLCPRRARRHGAAKCGGNYAASLIAQLEAEENGCKQVLFLDPFNDEAVEELGGMNVFFVMKGRQARHPATHRHHPGGRHPFLDHPTCH